MGDFGADLDLGGLGMAHDIMEGFAEKQEQVAVGLLGQFGLPRRLVGGKMPIQGFQHDRTGFAQVLDGADPVVALWPEQPNDIAHGADGFRGDAVDALQFIGRAGPVFGQVGEHLDAAQVAAHFIVEVAGDAFAHLGHLTPCVQAESDRQGDDQEQPQQPHHGHHDQPGAPPSGNQALGFHAQLVAAGFELQPEVQLAQPLAGWHQAAIGAEAVGERRAAPIAAARGDDIHHAVR